MGSEGRVNLSRGDRFVSTRGAGPPPRAAGGGWTKSIREIIRWGRVCLAAAAYIGFWLGGVVVSIFFLPVSWLRYRSVPRVEQAAACQRWVQRAFRVLIDFMRITGLVHFVPRSVDPTTPAGGFVLIANHPTLVDVAALTSVFGRFTCIAKTSFFRAPFLGRILRWCAYLDGGIGDPFSGIIVVKQGVERLAEGMPVLIFPEGTRSPEHELYPFKRGAFEIACRAKVPVFPVLIRCEPLALSKSKRWYQIPATTAYLTLTPLAVINPTEFGNDAAAMASACETMYRYHLNLPTIRSEQSDDGNRSRAKASHR